MPLVVNAADPQTQLQKAPTAFFVYIYSWNEASRVPN
jgi:hypothetical protein